MVRVTLEYPLFLFRAYEFNQSLLHVRMPLRLTNQYLTGQVLRIFQLPGILKMMLIPMIKIIGIITKLLTTFQKLIPGPPFLFGSLMVLFALFVNSWLPKVPPVNTRYFRRPSTSHSPQSSDDTSSLLHCS